jgi:hypothetical protein
MAGSIASKRENTDEANCYRSCDGGSSSNRNNSYYYYYYGLFVFLALQPIVVVFSTAR